jgi:hypothetical protein
MALLNSFIIANNYLSHPITYKQFKLLIIEGLISPQILENLSEKALFFSKKAPFAKADSKNPLETKENQFLRIESDHLPEKLATKYYKFCLVCIHNKIKKKSSMGCIDCSTRFARDVSLCVTDCFSLFHQNPKKYLMRNRRTTKENKEKDKELEKKQRKKMKEIKKIKKIGKKKKEGIARRIKSRKMRRFQTRNI